VDDRAPNASGLTAQQVAERVAAGQVNVAVTVTSRPVVDIIRSNVLTWFNLVLGILCGVMLVFGSWRDALFGLVLVINAAIGITQELRAKITLDRLSLISQPKVSVVRDGTAHEVDAAAVVLGDLVLLTAGEQIVVDGTLIDSAGLEVDESALTGESVPILKYAGDRVLSGSFVVAGGGRSQTTAVGADSYARRVEAQGRRYVRANSEIMSGINAVLRVIAVLIVPIGLLTAWNALQLHVDVSSGVTDIVAPLVAMVPEGLVLLSSIAFATSAVALARQHVLVNQLPAVEGLARTDVLCSDKTGTLTEPEPAFSGFELLRESTVSESEAREALAAMAGSGASANATVRAISAALPPPAEPWVARSSAAFSSARKWSGADFGPQGVWILGAPDVVLHCLREQQRDCERAATLAAERKRVLVLARTDGPLETERLPSDLAPVGLVILAERLRPDAAQTVAYLQSQGVTIKIISGDSMSTVSAVAEEAGVADADRTVDARSLTSGSALATAMEDSTVFGRVMPEQKSSMVSALQQRGHVVSMTGDGVNDVLGLKQADLGIAMGSGVAATKAVADIVLLDNRFATFPLIVAEGRRVVANAERVANLFLTKTAWAVLLAVAVVPLGLPYPLLPRQITLAGSLTIGIPAFFLALAPNAKRYRPQFLRRVLRFAVPAGAIAAVAILATFATALARGASMEEARTLSTLVLVVVSLGGLCVLEWPLRGWRLGLVTAMAAGMTLVFALPPAREFFALVALPASVVGSALAVSALAIAAIAANRRWGLARAARPGSDQG
jgi:cation-transporting P-type ATPase E